MIIADSSYLVAIHSLNDATHEKAAQLIQKVDPETTIIVPAEVFSETINTLWRKVNKATAISAIKNILSREEYSIPATTAEIYRKTLEKFEKAKKSVSFTDCLVMAFADHFKTKTILGFDETFSASGYRPL